MKFENEQKEKSGRRLIAAPSWAWLYLSIGILVLGSLFIWLIFGKIPITVSGRGILLTNVGLFSVQSRATGTVSKGVVKPGDFVRKGDLLMTIYDPQLELKLEKSKSMVAVLEAQLKNLKQEVESEESGYKGALMVKKNALLFNISQLEEEIDFASKELIERKKLVDEGLISPLRYNEAFQNIAKQKIEMQNKISDLALLDAEIKKEYRASEIKLKEQQLRQEVEDQKVIEVALQQGKILSPYDGYVLEVLVNVGDLVNIGSPLVWLEKISQEEQSYLIFGYFQVEKGKKIKPGTRIEMTVPNINVHRYGAITGTVSDVSLYAVSQEQLLSKIHNKSLINYLTNDAAAVIQATIIPDSDPKNPQLLHWTSGGQPPEALTAGTVGEIDVIVSEVRPFYYIIPIPAFKWDVGSNKEMVK